MECLEAAVLLGETGDTGMPAVQGSNERLDLAVRMARLGHKHEKQLVGGMDALEKVIPSAL